MRRTKTLAGLLGLALGAGACDSGTEPREERIRVTGTVQDAQSNTRLFFYDEDLNQLGPLPVQVRQDGSYGPISLEPGTFLGAGTASGFTTGEFVRFTVSASDDTLTVDFDLDPITVPLAVGNRWTYEEEVFAPAPDDLTVVVEIIDQQPGAGVPAVFTVEERRTDPLTGVGETTVYYLAQDPQGIRKSTDPAVDAADELLLKLPATLGNTWSTVDFATGVPLQKRITGFTCDEDRCQETNDFTIAQELEGKVFMSVAELHTAGDQAFVTFFSDIGIVDSFVQDTDGGMIVSQRKLRAFTAGTGG